MYRYGEISIFKIRIEDKSECSTNLSKNYLVSFYKPKVLNESEMEEYNVIV